MVSTLVAVLIVVAVTAAIAREAIGVTPKPATAKRPTHRAGLRARPALAGDDPPPEPEKMGGVAPAGPIEPVAVPLWRRIRAAGGLGLLIAGLGLAAAAVIAVTAILLGSLLDEALR